MQVSQDPQRGDKAKTYIAEIRYNVLKEAPQAHTHQQTYPPEEQGCPKFTDS